MQLAIDILIFILGFCIAVIAGTKPKEINAILNELSRRLQSLRSIIGSYAPRKEATIETQDELIPEDEAALLTKAQCESLSPETWQRQAYDTVKSILLASVPSAKKFPCIYATAGYRHNEHRYLFTHSEDPSEPRNIRLVASALRTYLPLSHRLGPNTSLVIVYPTSSSTTESTVLTYQEKFWSLLRGLRSADRKPWPSDIPTSTDAPKWAFCFDGVPWFPAAMTPAHDMRKSRHAENFVIAMQPKWVFDHLFRTPETRRAAVEKVRKLMPAYDDIEISPDLSAYGTEGTTEAHQYFLLDENKTSSCPFEDLDR